MVAAHGQTPVPAGSCVRPRRLRGTIPRSTRGHRSPRWKAARWISPRTVLPGVQVLFAFLLTAPFSQRFDQLDEFGGDLYGVALVGTALAAVILLAPASYHRIAPRRERQGRLTTAIRFMVTGMLVLGASIVVAVLTVMRFIFGPGVGIAVATGLTAVVLTLWYLVPLLRRLDLLGD